MKNRLELLKLFAERGFTKGVEVGVCDGRFSDLMLKTIPNLHLTCVDNWRGQWAPAFEKAQKLLGDRAYLYKGRSVDIANTIEDNSLDFVYIDGAHDYTNVRADIEAWTPKVREGGIVSGDDYYLTRHGNLGVIQAVNEYCNKHGYNLMTTLWDLDAYADDQQPNWYFYKENAFNDYR